MEGDEEVEGLDMEFVETLLFMGLAELADVERVELLVLGVYPPPLLRLPPKVEVLLLDSGVFPTVRLLPERVAPPLVSGMSLTLLSMGAATLEFPVLLPLEPPKPPPRVFPLG